VEGHAQVIGTGRPDASVQPADPGTDAARAVIRRAQDLSAALGDALAAPELRKTEAQRAYRTLRNEAAADELAQMPLERIKDVTHGRLMLSALEKAGFRTVGSVLTAGQSALDTVPGVGPRTAAQVIAAARQIGAALAGTVTVRIDPDKRTIPQANLLGALHAYERAQADVPPRAPDPAPLKDELDDAVAQSRPASSRLRMFFSSAGRKQGARDALVRLHQILGSAEAAEATDRLHPGAPAALTDRAPDSTALWQDYLARPVAYNGLLIDVAGLGPDQESAEGFLPAEIAERVRDQPLDLSLVTASLRGYQAFGAKFALAQRRVIIGDEMGLGKTLQALAAMAHLSAAAKAATAEAVGGDAAGPVHFLVVCPASVVVNWIREVTKHTTLTAHKLHGPGRDRARERWLAAGGVAVTTYEALRSLAAPGVALDPDGEGPAPAVPLAMMIVDEAHYAKNAAALRTKAVNAWADATPRVLFLTGTPMENRVEEFRTLVGHLRPDVADTVKDVDGMLGGTRFRRAVAPVYLRRNQDDVLSELPPRLETSDWVDLDGDALEAYRAAVAEGNFMKMRRAAFAVDPAPGAPAPGAPAPGAPAPGASGAPGVPGDSKKLDRLIDIVEEATDDGRKVVVFSFFRTVLDTIMTVLGDKALGPLTGDVPPARRQALVDEFTASAGPSVLVAQIQAGGVGLNIQAASVVILCEPQWNPAIEEQAIARAHRMGQVRRVDVHRLLAEHSVDQQMLELTAAKRREFDEYARRSDLAAATPDALDISDLAAVAEVASQIAVSQTAASQTAASQAEAERRIVTAERARLSVTTPPPASPTSANTTA
jgi:superfamily II DNA or RNA helicase